MKIREFFQLNPKGAVSQYDDFINYIDTSSVIEGNLIEIQKLTSDYPSRAKRVLKVDDILYSSVRPTLRHYYHYCNFIEQSVASTGFIVLRKINNSLIDTRFCFYFLTQSHIVRHLDSIAQTSQTTFPTFSYKDLGRIILPSFSCEKQRKIASILSAYDDLIENNNKRIKILEKMAENLYKEWFVRFRFPGHEQAEFENGIPKGWHKCKLRDLAREGGKYVNAEEAKKQEHYLPIDCIPNKKMVISEEDDIINAESSLHCFCENDILFGAMRPYFHKVIMAPFSGVTRKTCFVIKAKDMSYNLFLYLTLYQKSSVDYATTVSVGSTMPYVRWSDFCRLDIIIPPSHINDAFSNLVSPIVQHAIRFYVLNKNLTKQRDLLLPRLMSGKLKV